MIKVIRIFQGLVIKKLFFIKLKPVISIILLLAFMNMVTGCNYYLTRHARVSSDNIYAFQNTHRDIILHFGDKKWYFSDIEVKDDILNGVVDSGYTSLKLQHSGKRYLYNRKVDERGILNEVHIYISNYILGEGKRISVPFSAITRIEVYDKDISRTVASWVFGTIGVMASVSAVIGIIVLLTKDSCPFIYIYDGEGYSYIGEIFSGAIYSSLERDDYMPLPEFNSFNKTFQLKISNELKEHQNVNLAELIQIQHPKNTTVLIDKYGTAHTLSNLNTPLSAVSLHNPGYVKSLQERDEDFFLFNEYNPETGMSGIEVTFKKPIEADTGKLVIHAKNSLWGDYVYGKFTGLFGTYYNQWVEKQNHLPGDFHIKRALDQGVPLSVYLDTGTGWKFIDYFNLVGPLAARDMVMPLNLSKIKSDIVRIKLECGFMFWELDYAAMDFSPDFPVTINYLKPLKAVDQQGKNVINFINKDDENYLKQYNVGDEATINYPAPEINNNLEQTVILHSKGFYQPVRNYTGIPDVKYLNTFKKPGALSEFSKEMYDRICEENRLVTSKN